MNVGVSQPQDVRMLICHNRTSLPAHCGDHVAAKHVHCGCTVAPSRRLSEVWWNPNVTAIHCRHYGFIYRRRVTVVHRARSAKYKASSCCCCQGIKVSPTLPLHSRVVPESSL